VKKKQKPKVRLALQALCTLWLPWQTQKIHEKACFTDNEQNIKLPLQLESSHQSNRNKPDLRDDSDQMAL